MSNKTTKAVAIALSLASVVMMSGLSYVVTPAAAATSADIQAQINALMAQINTLNAQLGNTSSTSMTSSSYSFTRDLTVGSTGADVTALQQVLINGGYLKISAPTGYFGALTKAAVSAWQTASGVSPAAGYFGPKSRAALAASSAPTGGTTTGGTTTGGTTLTGGTTTVTTGSPMVSVASNTPVAGSIARGAKVVFTRFNVAAGSNPLTVTSFVATRIGLSADGDVNNLYLYDTASGAQLSVGSFNQGRVTFTGSPLFTVSAGSSKEVEVRADMSAAGTAGDSIGYAVNAAGDVNAGTGVTVGGTFPVNGSLFTIAAINTLGSLLVTSNANLSATINPGSLGANVGYFQFQGGNQPLSISYVRFTNIGSVGQTDLQNFKLMYNGTTQVGTTQQQAADKTVTFDLSASPMVIPSGNTVNVYLVADVLSGSTRTYQFTLQRTSDLIVQDTTYNTGIVPSFTIVGGQAPVPAGAMNQVQVAAGSATMSVDTTSPTGNIAVGATSQTLGVFSFTGSGEDVRVNSLTVTITPTNMTAGAGADFLKNGRLVDVTNGTPGSQIGSTANFAFTPAVGGNLLGNTIMNIPGYWTIPAGTTRKLAVEADIVAGTATAAQLTNAGTGTLTAGINTIAAQGVNSLQAVVFGASTGRVLTVVTGGLTGSLNSALLNGTAASPTAVPGQTAVRLGSFNLTAGSAEGVTVTQVDVKLDALAGTQWQNVKAMIGSAQIGQTYGAVTNSQVLTFNPTSQLQIAAGNSVTVDVYGDVQGGMPGVPNNFAGTTNLGSVTATGMTDNQVVALKTAGGVAITDAAVLAGQSPYIAANGTLTVATDPQAPTASQLQQLVAGSTQQTMAVFNLAASPAENLNVTSVRVTDTEVAANKGIGDFQNIKLYVNGTAVCNGLAVPSLTADPGDNTEGDAVWNLQSCPLVIQAGNNVSMYVKADVTAFPNATPGATHNFNLEAAGDITGLGAISGVAANSVNGVAGVNAAVYRTALTIAKDATSPSGLSSSSATQIVAVYDLSNATNGSNSQALILPSTGTFASELDFSISSTLPITANASRTFAVFKSSDLTTPVLQAVIHTGTPVAGTWNGVLSFINTNGVITGEFTPTAGNSVGSQGAGVVTADAAGGNAGYITDPGMVVVPQTVNPGQQQSYTVEFDSTDRSATGQTFTLSINTQAGNKMWADGALGATDAVTTINGLPQTFGTLQY